MIDWDEAFDNSGHVAGAQDLPEIWQGRAIAFRAAANADLDVAYGPGPRECFDMFHTDGAPEGTVIFVHGGYWHKFDKSCWSHLAAGCLASGWSVAMISYPLAPEARIARIVRSAVAAVNAIAGQTDGALRLVGHSAGGHLVARTVCAGELPDAVAARIARVVAVSGIFDLLPLTATGMNATLGLTAAEAVAESPTRLEPRMEIQVTFWVGAAERPEFLRQTRAVTEAWAERGALVADVYEAGQSHFSIIDALADPDSALTREVLR